jgi:ribosomal protein L19
MKNPFKTFRDLKKTVKEHDEYITNQKAKAFFDGLEKYKKDRLESWEKENPPKFKYGDAVQVGIYEKSFRSVSPHKEWVPLYTGKIISFKARSSSFLKMKEMELKWGFDYIYVIDTGDFIYHEAKESHIKLNENK